MPDIAMCPNFTCPKREDCYTYRCQPSPYRQAYMSPDWTQNEDGTVSCPRFSAYHPRDPLDSLLNADRRNMRIAETSVPTSGSKGPPVAESKQVILIRADLKMPKGKACAQGAHASLQALLSQGKREGLNWTIPLRPDQIPWLEGSYAKVCLRVTSEEELMALCEMARERGLPTAVIRDEGRTVFNGPTTTCGAIGPADGDLINEVTAGLKLY